MHFDNNFSGLNCLQKLKVPLLIVSGGCLVGSPSDIGSGHMYMYDNLGMPKPFTRFLAVEVIDIAEREERQLKEYDLTRVVPGKEKDKMIVGEKLVRVRG